jgi:trehalose-phosphatase
MKPMKRTIWAFDFDGTISQIVPNRREAELDPACKTLLTELADTPTQIVAVISSRSLEDLRSRFHIENVILAGGSGLEWLIPGGHCFGPNAPTAKRVELARQRILPLVSRIGKIAGVEIEDKHWSVALHSRSVPLDLKESVRKMSEELRIVHNVTLHYGPEVAEIQFLKEVTKEIAVRTLVKKFGRGNEARSVVYAGDDQNDANAMKWVLARQGSAYVVGDRISVKGAWVVSSPHELVSDIRRRILMDSTTEVNTGKGTSNG